MVTIDVGKKAPLIDAVYMFSSIEIAVRTFHALPCFRAVNYYFSAPGGVIRNLTRRRVCLAILCARLGFSIYTGLF